MTYKIPVMVTGVGGGGHGEQILKALRMANTRYKIIGSDMSPFSKGLKEVDHPYVVPSAKSSGYLDSILRICKKHKVAALFHGSEPELLILSKYRDVIQRENIFLPINPKSVIDICMNKFKTFEFLNMHSFSCPKTLILKTMADLDNWSEFPAILKPSIGGGGSAHTFIVQHKWEARLLFTYMKKSMVSPEIIIQAYKGTPETEFTVGVLFDMDGNFINSIAVKRDLRSSLSCRIRIPNRIKCKEFGANLSVSTGVSQGKIGRYPIVTAPCERLGKALGGRGTLNIQCRFHNGKVYVFEINPRFSGTTSLRAMVGYNEPDILVRRHVLGQKIKPRFKYKSGIIVRGLCETFF